MIKIGAIGCGYWGPNLIRNFLSLDNCIVKWCADLNKTRLDRIKSFYHGIKTTTCYQDILKDKDVDAVALATPAATHYTIAKDALKAGKHLLVEKPFVLRSVEGEVQNNYKKQEIIKLR